MGKSMYICPTFSLVVNLPMSPHVRLSSVGLPVIISSFISHTPIGALVYSLTLSVLYSIINIQGRTEKVLRGGANVVLSLTRGGVSNNCYDGGSHPSPLLYTPMSIVYFSPWRTIIEPNIIDMFLQKI